jgi:hypothetical protein
VFSVAAVSSTRSVAGTVRKAKVLAKASGTFGGCPGGPVPPVRVGGPRPRICRAGAFRPRQVGPRSARPMPTWLRAGRRSRLRRFCPTSPMC